MNRKHPDLNLWKPWQIDKTAFGLYDLDWILAGGVALERFVGAPYRKHMDIDILIKRTDQERIIESIAQNRVWVAETPGTLTPFKSDYCYEKPGQDFWITNLSGEYWCLQIMLIDVVDDRWIYRRNCCISAPLQLIYFDLSDTKILRPEIQLLYKSKNIRARDELDYEKVYPLLTSESRNWLSTSLKTCYPAGYPSIL